MHLPRGSFSSHDYVQLYVGSYFTYSAQELASVKWVRVWDHHNLILDVGVELQDSW